jgi:hypothetical protein
MNIVEVQDNLKNFSQDQLISEINQPSGMVPQFLVLTELGRRNRMKQDIEGRQAQNQPTVAQEVVSAAGVPQGGIMDMARSMAPKSSIEQNDGVEMMAEGGAVKMQQGTVVYKGKTYFTDGTYVATKGQSGRIVSVDDPEIVEAVTNKSPSVKSNVETIKNISTNVKDFAPNIPFSTTADPELDRSAFSDSVLGIKPEMIAQLPDQGNPNFSSDKDTQKAVSEIAGVNPLINEAAATDRENSLSMFPVRTGQQNQPQDPFDRYLGEIAGIGSTNFKTASARNAELEDAELELDVANSSAFIEPGQFDTRPRDADGNLITKPKKPLPFNELPGAPTRNETLLQDLITQNQTLIPGVNVPRQQTFLSNQPQVQEELIKEIKNAPDYNFSNDPTKGYSDPGGGLESYFGTTESIRNDPYNLKNIIKAASQTSNADDFTQTVQSLARSKAELEGGIPSDELSFEPFNNQPIPPFLPSGSGDTPDELMVPFDNTPSKGKGGDDGGDGNDDDKGSGTKGGGTKGGSALGSLESEIANMLRENEDQQEKDKYLSLAKAGLALMASDQPTFGGALGEAGMAGIEDFQASRKSYRDDKITLLDAQRKLEQARATAAAKDKSGLTGTNVVSRLNNIQTRKTGLLQKIAELENPQVPSLNPEKTKQSIEILRREVADLSVKEKIFESMLGGIGSLAVDLNATAN